MGNRTTGIKPSPVASLTTTNPTRTGLQVNPCLYFTSVMFELIGLFLLLKVTSHRLCYYKNDSIVEAEIPYVRTQFNSEYHAFHINHLTSNDTYMGRTAPLTPKVTFYIFIQQIQVLNILNMVYTLRFFPSSKCSLFHNSNVFGSCIIHILYTGCAKI